jgi:hypothetical protein
LCWLLFGGGLEPQSAHIHDNRGRDIKGSFIQSVSCRHHLETKSQLKCSIDVEPIWQEHLKQQNNKVIMSLVDKLLILLVLSDKLFNVGSC